MIYCILCGDVSNAYCKSCFINYNLIVEKYSILLPKIIDTSQDWTIDSKEFPFEFWISIINKSQSFLKRDIFFKNKYAESIDIFEIEQPLTKECVICINNNLEKYLTLI